LAELPATDLDIQQIMGAHILDTLLGFVGLANFTRGVHDRLQGHVQEIQVISRFLRDVGGTQIVNQAPGG
jgi:hypothetical protein